MKHPVTRKTTAALKELEHESARMAACLCAAIDAIHQAVTYADRKGSPVGFTSDNISSIGLSLYIRRRDEQKSAGNNFSKSSSVTRRTAMETCESRPSAPDVTDGARTAP